MFAVLLVLAAVGLIWMHWRTWQQALDAPHENAEEQRFAWLQFRRRVQSSGMIGLVGLGIFIGQFIRSPVVWVFFWTGIALLLVWILLLALADAFATQQHFGRLRRQEFADHVREQAKLSRQLKNRSEESET